MMASLLLASLSGFAQLEKGTWSLTPKAGVNFANMTNSTVIASTSEIVAGYKYDGSIVKTTDPNGQFIVSHGNFKSSSATNVRIHSALGISWAEENTSKSFDVSPLVQPTFMTP